MTQPARRGQGAARGQEQPLLSTHRPLCSGLSFPGAREPRCGGMQGDGSAPTPAWRSGGGLLVSGGPGAGAAGEFPPGWGRRCWPLRGSQRRSSIWLRRCVLEGVSVWQPPPQLSIPRAPETSRVHPPQFIAACPGLPPAWIRHRITPGLWEQSCGFVSPWTPRPRTQTGVTHPTRGGRLVLAARLRSRSPIRGVRGVFGITRGNYVATRMA